MPGPWHIRSDVLYLEEEVGELGASEVRRLRQLEEENARLKRVVADLTLDKNILQEVIRKKV
jgi:putative transposase